MNKERTLQRLTSDIWNKQLLQPVTSGFRKKIHILQKASFATRNEWLYNE